MSRELGIYVHIPFCKKKCNYCDFISYTNKQEEIKKYIDKIKQEINSYDLKKYNITTIYIGGGTPSFIDSKYIGEILQEITKKKIDLKNIEVTLEINPGTVNELKLQEYKKVGINRISIGLQSTNNELLQMLGRIHSFEEFLKTYKLCRKMKFENINVDLMIGLPKQTIEHIKQDLEIIKKLNPEHVSVYSLIVEEGTVIEKQLKEGNLCLPSEELERNMYWYVKNNLELNGYNHYEISNYAKNGKKSKHNLNCWEQKEYVGIGVAAHSYLNNIRYSNTIDLEKYISADFSNNKDLLNTKVRNIEEIQDLETKQKEYMLLALRKIEGIRISDFKEKYVQNPIYLYKKQLEKLVSQKLISIDGDFIKLTNKGLDFANIVWQEFI